ncbi:MAG: ribonuclease Z [Nitrospinota bacterium]|nr:ribonuclease Z [Nitrospinota bacterium]
MKPTFHPKLVNDPFGDPGLLVQFLFESRVLLFDLGDLSSIPNKTLLNVTYVFVSHTHIDHFIGFDKLLRICFGRNKTISLYGPENFINNVEGKLAGFTWNLVDRYHESITLQVTEVRKDGLRRATFRAIDKFSRADERQEPFSGSLLLEEPFFCVHAAILEHRVPCLGFTLNEKYHVNIRKDRLQAQNFRLGPWLNELKDMIYREQADDELIVVPIGSNGTVKEYTLGELKEDLVIISPGQKIGYITDTVFNEENNRRIVGLVQGADRLFCESPFLAEEEERGRERCHLTTRQAGTLAKMAAVKELTVFHFSAKHLHRREQMYREAHEAFLG